MFRNLTPPRAGHSGGPSANSRRSANPVAMAVPLNWRLHPCVMPMAIATVLAGAAIVIAYASLLSRDSLPVSAPALSAVLLASTLSSVAGFAFSAICGVMLLHMISDPVQVVEIMMVCSVALQSLSVAVLWRDIDWRGLWAFLVGGAIGLPFGVWLLLNLELVWFKHAVGSLLTAYAAYGLLKQPVTIRFGGNVLDACVGFIGGITGGLVGFPGAAVTIWCGMRGWDKRRQRGIYQPFILIMQILALLLIQLMRSSVVHGVVMGLNPLQFIPVALLGTWFGLAIFRRLSDRSFALAVNLLLLASGVGLLI